MSHTHGNMYIYIYNNMLYIYTYIYIFYVCIVFEMTRIKYIMIPHTHAYIRLYIHEIAFNIGYYYRFVSHNMIF